jgi:hypothetical protein
MPTPGLSPKADLLLRQLQAGKANYDAAGAKLQADTDAVSTAEAMLATAKQSQNDSQGSLTSWGYYDHVKMDQFIEQLRLDNGEAVPNPTPDPAVPPIPAGGVPVPTA